jgi:hypothetical protein
VAHRVLCFILMVQTALAVECLLRRENKFEEYERLIDAAVSVNFRGFYYG